jgi:4-hydroxybenzoate polyprenyltransferase
MTQQPLSAGIRRLRGTVVMARPPVFVLLALYAQLGLAEVGKPNAYLSLLKILAVIAAFLIFSVACNDLADEAIDRVNLPGDPRRPLVSGAVTRAQMRTTAYVAAGAALAVSAFVGWPALVITAVGLGVSGAYSVRPVRVAERGVLAPLLLPACYVAVPYLLGTTTAHHAPTGRDLVLLGGLYLGFIGRILLKDFRDVRGDAMFGKRTFLVRYGRRWTCVFSAVFWVAGTIVILVEVPGRSGTAYVAPFTVGVCAAFAILLIGGLAADGDPHRDEALISGVAILGRGMIVLLITYLSLLDLQIHPFISFLLMDLLAALVLLQAMSMVRYGPRLRFIPEKIEDVDSHSLVS